MKLCPGELILVQIGEWYQNFSVKSEYTDSLYCV